MSEARPARLLLASRSPQRRAILSQLGVPFVARPADVPERESGDAALVARENARAKARAAARQNAEGLAVLGVDTVVALGERLLGKPDDAQAARAGLRALSGRTHVVVSGLCLLEPDGAERGAVARTRVRFRPLTPAAIETYVATGEWRERAGGYAIQARGAALVRWIDGDYLNVVGLPAAALFDLRPELLE